MAFSSPDKTTNMTWFWILWIFVALMSLIPIYFFFIGLADGTVTMKNLGLWLIILAVIAGVLFGSLWLQGHDRLPLAKTVLVIAAIPGLLVIIFVLVNMIAKPRWN